MAHTHHLQLGGREVRKRFRSWDRGEAEREWAALSVLAEHAPGLAPRPLRREEDDGAPVIVMERLPGVPLGDRPLTAAQTSSLGTALRRMYDVPLSVVRGAGIGERLYGPTSHPLEVARWLREPADLAPCRDATLVREAIEAGQHWLDTTDRMPSPRLRALGIADLNPANVLWDGTVCRLVDFEDGGLSDPAFELADHVEHVAGRLTHVYDPDGLIEAVGLSEDDRARVAAYRPLWAMFWLAMLLPGNGGWHRNPPGTTEGQARHVLRLLLDP